MFGCDVMFGCAVWVAGTRPLDLRGPRYPTLALLSWLLRQLLLVLPVLPGLLDLLLLLGTLAMSALLAPLALPALTPLSRVKMGQGWGVGRDQRSPWLPWLLWFPISRPGCWWTEVRSGAGDVDHQQPPQRHALHTLLQCNPIKQPRYEESVRVFSVALLGNRRRQRGMAEREDCTPFQLQDANRSPAFFFARWQGWVCSNGFLFLGLQRQNSHFA
jgi:hypothetical protein